MVVQHNLQAMNANRMLGITVKNVASSTEKLSSGYRINRAADDAAGLSISEKMRKQIRGLTRASSNAADGISSVQTAEGALAEVQDMLQRMNELCVQAANGTNSKTDRQYIQDEIDQLVTEVDRVAVTTKFNDTYLLKGDEKARTTKQYTTDYRVTNVKNEVTNAEAAPVTQNTTNGYGDIVRTDIYKPLDYKINYKGEDPIYMISSDILTADENQPIRADLIKTGDEITKYFYKATTPACLENNDAEAALDTRNYQAFVAVELDSYVDTGENGVVRGLMTHDRDDTHDLSTDGTTSRVRANKTLYIYDKQLESITRLEAGSDLTKYLTPENTVAERYRLVDILDGSETRAAQYRGNEDGIDSTNDELYLYQGTSTSYYTSGGDTYGRNVILLSSTPQKLQYDDTITDTYYSSQNRRTGFYTDSNSSVMAASNVQWAYAKTNINVSNYVSSSNTWTGGSSLVLKAKAAGSSGTQGNIQNNELVILKYGQDLSDFATKYGLAVNNANFELLSIYGEELTEEGYITSKPFKDLVSLSGTSEKVRNQILDGKHWSWDNNSIEIQTDKRTLYNADGEEVCGIALNKYFDKDGKYTGGLYTNQQARVIDRVFADNTSEEYRKIHSLSGNTPAVITDYIIQIEKEVQGDLSYDLHVGADSSLDNKIGVNIQALTAAGLGIDKLHSDYIGIVDETGKNATAAIDVVADALQKISTQRSLLGSVQNRLEHTIKNLDNVVENTTTAESAIRDTDMAKEMVAYSNGNVLQQAGQAMLSQANQANQGILSLIQ